MDMEPETNMTKTYTFDEQIVSDLHKDAYGYRPVAAWWTEWRLSDDDGKQQIWDAVVRASQLAVALDEQERLVAKADFEEKLAQFLDLADGDRETALRWFIDSLPEYERDMAISYGADYLMYHFNLPSSYFNELETAAASLRKQ